MTYSKTMSLNDYSLFESEIRGFDLARSQYAEPLDTEHRAWEVAVALRASQEQLCSTALVIGGHNPLLANLLHTIGIQVTYFSNIEMPFPDQRYDAIFVLSALEHVEFPELLWEYASSHADRLIVATVDFSSDGRVYDDTQKRTYTAYTLRTLHDQAVLKGWYSYHRPEWDTVEPLIDGSYTMASLCMRKYHPVPMFDITFFSIMRQAEDYVERYERQIRSALDLFKTGRVVVVEGDSTDCTKIALTKMRHHLITDGYAMEIVSFDTKQPMIGSVDHAGRWRNLERCWNEALWHYLPTQYAVCIESDLIWDVAALRQCLELLNQDVAQVIYPALFTFSKPEWFHDINGFVEKTTGKHFTNEAPHIPLGLPKNQRLVPLVTGGGMIVCRGDTLRGASWKDKCRLHFPESVSLMADMHTRIYHP